MNANRRVFAGRYRQGKPFVRAKVVVVNPINGRQITIEKNFWIDTGFEGGFHIAEVHLSEIRIIGVDPAVGSVGLAGGERRRGYFCFAFLQQIEDYELPPPGIEATLILQGSSDHGLLGLEVLKNFTVKFDGPNEMLTILSGSNDNS